MTSPIARQLASLRCRSQPSQKLGGVHQNDLDEVLNDQASQYHEQMACFPGTGRLDEAGFVPLFFVEPLTTVVPGLYKAPVSSKKHKPEARRPPLHARREETGANGMSQERWVQSFEEAFVFLRGSEEKETWLGYMRKQRLLFVTAIQRVDAPIFPTSSPTSSQGSGTHSLPGWAPHATPWR